MQDLRYLDGVSTLQLSQDICVGCGLCIEVCPHGVFVLDEHKVHIQDLDGCMECGACVNNCPTSAISVTPGVG